MWKRGKLRAFPHEHILNYYEKLQAVYGWTIHDIDETELEVLLSQLVLMARKNVRKTYIEDVMG